MSTFKVTTQINLDAIPEYIEPAPESSESIAYKQSITDAYNSYLHPEGEVQNSNNASLNQRAKVYRGFTDENMPPVSRSNVSGTANIQNIVPDSKSDAFKKWLDEQAKKSSLHRDEEVQNGNKASLEKRTEVSADKNMPRISRSNASGVVKSKL